MATDGGVMIFYQLPFSHYCGKVRIVLLEKGLAPAMPSLPGGSTRSKEYLAINPLGKVPVLEDKGLIIGESESICEYLEERCPEPPMLPEALHARARSRWLSRIHDLYLAPQLSLLFGGVQSRRLEDPTLKPELQKLEALLQIIEESVDPKPYFFGRAFGLSDAAYCLSFWYAISLARQYGAPLSPESYPKLFAWYAQAAQRPSVSTTLDVAKDALGLG